MFQAESYIHSINQAERGMPRMEIMSDAIEQADAENAHYWRIYFRYEYIKESNFHEDNFKAIIMFPTLLQVFDEHPELEDDTYDDVMRAFKWVLENMPGYYQISREEIENYYEEYKKRCEKYGFSLRVYHMKRSKFYLPIDMEISKAAYRAFRECKRDANSDCEACEINHDMTMALEFGEEEEALRIAVPVLEGSKRCGEVPHVTYGALTKYYLYQGNLNEAAYYGNLCERYTQNKPEFLEESGYLLELYSAVDPAYGWRIFKRNIENFVQCKNPRMKMTFARGAYRLLQLIAKKTEYFNNTLLKALPLSCSDNGYRAEDMVKFFYDIAKQHSELLDKRNGSSYYMELLNIQLQIAETEAEIQEKTEHKEHGMIGKINNGTLIAIPSSEEIPTLKELEQRLTYLTKELELISHSIDTDRDEKSLYFMFRCEGKIYEAHLIWIDSPQEITGRRCYGLDEETYAAIHASKKQLLLIMEYSDDILVSYHLAMHILHCMLPDMLGVMDMMTQKIYPANWVAFAGACKNAVSVSDLFDLYISGTPDSDEIWMTTRGLCTMGLRELEVIGATRENFGYFADILHYTACQAAENSMLPDAGEYITDIRAGGTEVALVWKNTEDTLRTLTDSFAQEIERVFPSGVLYAVTEQGEHYLLTDYSCMMQGEDLDFPDSHSNFVRRIYLAKETLPNLKCALALPYAQAAVRLEFSLSQEMRNQCGYSKELLWAEISAFQDGVITARLVETSDLLPECHEDDEVVVSEENLTGWMIRSEDGRNVFTEENAYYFMKEGIYDER